ncbi:MAG: alpha/beta fold hydrolase [Polyangiaceae bacterium]|nr:alpha/beta fold hydrolase [Polyangiaceae bacterium]
MTRSLWLHGFLGAPSAFSALGARASDVSVPTLGGHGLPAAPVPRGFHAELSRLGELLGQHDGWQLVGYSLGARLALGLALAQPARFARLVLVGVHPGLDTEAARRERVLLDDSRARALEQRGLEAFVAEWETLPLLATQRALPAEVRARHRAMRTAHDAHAIAGALVALGLGRMPSLWSGLSQLQLPVTFVVGELDEKFVALARRGASLAPRAELVIVPGVGHDVILERPRAVAEVLA